MGTIMRGRTAVLSVCVGVLISWMATPASAQVRYSGGRAYTAGPGYYGGGYGGGYYNGGYSNQQFGYGPAGAWNALSRRNGYDPLYVVQPQPVYVQQPVYVPPQPTLYLGGTGYQYAPTVYGRANAIYRGY
jgi:hypothetical protein